MPSLKRNVAHAPDSTGFESYDGPQPPLQQRMYRGRIEFVRIREASTGRLGINMLVKFLAEKGDKDNAKYDGYPAWVTLWLADKEPNQVREKNFYRAVGVPDDKLENVNIVHEDVEDGGEVKKVGGRNPVGRIVKVDMRTERYEEELQLRADAVYPAKESKAADADPDESEEEPDEDLLEDAEESEEEWDEEARREELGEMKLPDLRSLASSDYEIETKGKKRQALIEEIIAHEAPEEEEPEDEEEESEEEEEELPDYNKMSEMKVPALRKWAVENGDYDEDDVKGLKKQEILDMLVEDELIENPEPPF